MSPRHRLDAGHINKAFDQGRSIAGMPIGIVDDGQIARACLANHGHQHRRPDVRHEFDDRLGAMPQPLIEPLAQYRNAPSLKRSTGTAAICINREE